MTGPSPLLRTLAAPHGPPRLVTLRAPLANGRVVLAYVPDRLTLERASFLAFLTVLTAADAEPLAAHIADAVANELVPRWHRVTVHADTAGLTESVTIEDRQPGWDHPSLLSAAQAD